MNLLQSFLVEANQQARPIIQEEFTIVGDLSGTIYFGTFGDPVIMPVMTRQGYQDHLVTPLKAEKSQWPITPPGERISIIRTQTGRTLFVQVVDFTEAVVYTFILTDRSL